MPLSWTVKLRRCDRERRHHVLRKIITKLQDKNPHVRYQSHYQAACDQLFALAGNVAYGSDSDVSHQELSDASADEGPGFDPCESIEQAAAALKRAWLKARERAWLKARKVRAVRFGGAEERTLPTDNAAPLGPPSTVPLKEDRGHPTVDLGPASVSSRTRSNTQEARDEAALDALIQGTGKTPARGAPISDEWGRRSFDDLLSLYMRDQGKTHTREQPAPPPEPPAPPPPEPEPEPEPPAAPEPPIKGKKGKK